MVVVCVGLSRGLLRVERGKNGAPEEERGTPTEDPKRTEGCSHQPKAPILNHPFKG